MTRNCMVAALVTMAHHPSPDHAPRGAFLEVWPTVARRRSVRLDRCEVTRCATRLGLICLCGGSAGARPRGSRAGRHQAERDGSEQRPLRATRRQLDANARDILDHTRADLDQALPD